MAMALRSAGRRLITGQLPPQGIHRAAVEGQRRLLPTAISSGCSLGYSRQYGTFERCMRIGDLFVRATTAVSIISVSTAVLALSVALPVKMYRKKRQDTFSGRDNPPGANVNSPVLKRRCRNCVKYSWNTKLDSVLKEGALEVAMEFELLSEGGRS